MNQHPPILIGAPARSGTTMIAGLIHFHGVWIGKARVTKSPSTNPLVGTENIRIKEYLKRLDPRTPSGEFREAILSMVETDGPWLVKTAQVLLKYRNWNNAFPDARWILPIRPENEIVASAMRHPGMAKRGEFEQRRRVQYMQELQGNIAAQCRHTLYVNPGRIATRDYTAAELLMLFCRLELDREVWDKWIDPARWHGATKDKET